MRTSQARTIPAFVGFLLCNILLSQNGPVTPTGAMRNTMFNGQLAGLIAMDSLAVPGTYGIGPVEYLRGELLLLDGQVFRSTAHGDSAMTVEVHADTKAPFFVHQHIREWTVVELPDSVNDLVILDAFLTARYGPLGQPFAFCLTGTFTTIEAHIVDVAPGTAINGPDDAHRDNKHYRLTAREAETIGFFSTMHKAVFTHHDTNIHVHAVTKERDWMGHVEHMRFDPWQVTLRTALN